MSTVLVTGGSGFIGAHVVARLLKDGHRVRTTVRTLRREPNVRAMLAKAGVAPDAPLAFAEADLERDAGWGEAADGCEHVLHVASPFPIGAPKDANQLIVPAREGTLRVLRAARAAGAKRVVVTSSFAAIGYGHPEQAAPFDETTWTNTATADTQAYMQSKTLAERAAWAYVADEGRGLELATVNPVGVFGPVLGPDLSSSIRIVRMMLDGKMPVCPRISFGVVDVRDVADLHLLAMTHPAAAGQRFLATNEDSVSLMAIATLLRRRLGRAGRRAPRLELPDGLVRAMALVVPQVREVVPHLGKIRRATAAKARLVLGWHPRSNEEAILATAESLLGL